MRHVFMNRLAIAVTLGLLVAVLVFALIQN